MRAVARCHQAGGIRQPDHGGEQRHLATVAVVDDEPVHRPPPVPQPGERDVRHGDHPDVLPATFEDEEPLPAMVGGCGGRHEADGCRLGKRCQRSEREEDPRNELDGSGEPGVQGGGTQPEAVEPPGRAREPALPPHLVRAVREEHRTEAEPEHERRQVGVAATTPVGAAVPTSLPHAGPR